MIDCKFGFFKVNGYLWSYTILPDWYWNARNHPNYFGGGGGKLLVGAPKNFSVKPPERVSGHKA
jgi:hypothetical protein